MSPLAAILSLALAAPNGTAVDHPDAGHYPGATEVLKYTFEPTSEEEFYIWPPGWTSLHGPGYPRYVRPRIDDAERLPPGGRSFRVDLNGGAASAFGPAIPIDPGVDYVLEGYVKTSALRHDAAWLSLTFKDAARAKLAETASEKIDGTSSWRKVRIGPLTPPTGASMLFVGIHLAPKGEEQDLNGTAWFGALWVGQLPRVVLTARAVDFADRQPTAASSGTAPFAVARGGASFLVFARDQQTVSAEADRNRPSKLGASSAPASPLEVDCLVSGFAASRYDVRLELQDASGRTVARHEEHFSTVSLQTAVTKAKGDSHGASGAVASHDSSPAHVIWRIPVNTVGYYRVRAEVVPSSFDAKDGGGSNGSKPVPRSTCAAAIGLAIVDRQPLRPGSEFGWSLDPGDDSRGLVPLADLLAQSGIRWVKFPFVCSLHQENETAKKQLTSALPATRGAVEPLINFSDRLTRHGMQVAGVLLPPREPGQGNTALLAAEAFALDPKVWYPSLEPILARLGTEIRCWQIGGDRDSSWVGCGELPAVVARIKATLDRVGQDLDIGLAWDLAAPLPVDARNSKGASIGGNGSRNEIDGNRLKLEPQTRAPWRFLSLSCDESATDAELAKRLDATASAAVARWLAIDALPQSGHSADDRIAHLIGRMLTAKMHGAEGIFFAHPLDAQRGLASRDGSPSELFLPWRTTALMLGGAPYAGDIDLAGGSRMHCFGSSGQYVGLIASDPGAPGRRDAVYLGDHLQTCDLWGRVADVPTALDKGARSTIDVQRLSTFLTGLDGTITQWQLNTGFAPKSLLSVPTAVAVTALEMRNTLPGAVSGHLRITPPRDWRIEPSSADFHIEPGAVWKLPLKVILPNDVLAGPQLLALEFELQTDRLIRFTAYRPVEVSGGDVTINGRATSNDSGDLEVRQSLSNQGNRAATFRCSLMVPNRRRQSATVIVQPGTTSAFVYHFSNGRELLGKPLWLRAEEIGGPRVLNCVVEAR
jgi:hypothetical protein